MQLYANSISPFVRKVRITLYEKAVDFETIEIDRGAARTELLRVNPRGEVPALVDGAIVVSGSAAICDYLEEIAFRPAMLPANAAARVRCRALEQEADTHSDALQFLAFLLAVRRPELGHEYPHARRDLSDEIRRHYHHLDRTLADRPYFVGDFSRADVSLFPHLTGLGELGDAMPDGCTHLRSWRGRMLARPSVQRDATEALRAWEAIASNPDPFFRADRIHWRGARIEWAIRIGLGSWLLRETAAGRAYFSPAPGEEEPPA